MPGRYPSDISAESDRSIRERTVTATLRRATTRKQKSVVLEPAELLPQRTQRSAIAGGRLVGHALPQPAVPLTGLELNIVAFERPLAPADVARARGRVNVCDD
jgi:hypothetical protein